ncbi:MAG TPA: DMT family transporter [Sphingomicrobium sp.]|nr:DMT family transporter [Sphingomicrobium sp.]
MPVLVPILLVFIAGALVALQAPTNSILAKAGNSAILAALISFCIGTVALFLAWFASSSRPGAEAFAGLPWYAWLGGLYGAVFVAVAAYAAPKIGVASLITVGIAGQIAMALWLDHVGAMGLAREPVSLGRLIGALMVVAGVVLVRRN